MTANQACCACGGGDHFLPSTSPSISTMPTVSAAPTSLCLDAPEDWFDEEHGLGCDFFSESSYNYYSNDDWVWQRCIDYGDVLQDENGLQAKDACCACGGGLDRDFDAPSDAPTLSPEPSASLIPSTLPSLSQEPTTSSAPTKVCFDVEYWLDQYGHDCAWYEPNTWYDDYYYESTYMCTYYGDAYENEDLKMSANQACCTCGGGQHTLPTPPPTVSTQPSSSAAPTSLCVDDPVDWKDSENQFGCTFFEQELDDWWYDEEESRCDLYWHWRDDNNVDVRDACCACGGGKLRDLDAPSDMPSVSMNPTISPAPTPKEHELVTTFEGGNGANGNIFDLVALRYLAIREFDVHTDSQFSDVMVYSKSGSYIGYEYQESAWTFILETEVVGKGEGNRTPLPANTTVDVEIMPDESAAFCIILSSGVSYTNGDYPGNQLFASNDHLKFYEGAGLGSSYIGGSVYAYRIWNGAIRYSLLKLTDAPTAPPTLSMMPSMSSVPTMEPTVSAEPTSSVEPTMVCEDVVGWFDSFGDGCDWFDDDYRYYDDDFYYDDAFIRARNLQNTRAPTNSPNNDGSISPQTAQTRAPTNSPNSNGSIAPQTAQTKVPTSTITSQPVQPPSSYYYDDDANNTWSRCEAYGDFAGGMFNLTANQACCVCGGGQHTLPTASPTVSAAPTVSSAPTSVCEDDPAEWMDDYFGVTCETFDNDPDLCIEWDWLSDINDVEAKEACCACGGGMKRDPRAPSDMPSLSMQPTISSAPTSSERELMTTMDGYSYGYGNMFDLTALRYLAIRELDLHCYYSYGIGIIAYIYTKDGTHMNSEYDPDAWAQAGKAQMSSTAGEGNLTPVPATAFGNGTIVEIMPNATVAFCILLDSRVVISSYGSYQGNVFASDDNLIFYEGVGLQTSYIGGYVYSPLVWNGAIRYSFLKLTDKPSISPSISLAPSVSNAPTMEPTISAEPSISAKPTKSCADVPNWHDRHDDGCDWYDADINRCATYGDHHGGLFNMTANQACCVCGGGDHRMPSAAPTVTAAPTITAQPTGECTNHNSWGIEEIEMHCGWFEDDDPLYYFYMDDGDTRCDMFGFMSDENNVPAREACCVCGGGTKRERITTGPPTATPSLLPTVEPTNAPSSTPNVEPTSSPSIEPSEVVTQTVEPSSTPSVKPSVASQSNVVQETSSSVSSTWSSLRLSFLAVLVQGFFCV
uniref:Uncharacterized protein n=1 Tax=Leptocylindrus danicus TaxID=163516 RepID=A0A7S2KW41_9STRA